MTTNSQSKKWDNLLKQGKAMNGPSEKNIVEALKMVQDPEMGLGLVDLGLIYDVHVEDSGEVRVRMTLTTPACPYGEILINDAKGAVESVEGVTSAEINLVWDPPWDPKTMCSDLAKDVLGIW